MKIEDIRIEISFTDKVVLGLEAKFDNMTQMQHFLDTLKEAIEKEIVNGKFDDIIKEQGKHATN